VQSQVVNTSRQPENSPDVGATFVELLVSVVLLGIAGTAVLAAVAAAAQGASAHRDVAEVQSQLGVAADFMMSTDSAYQSCADPAYVIATAPDAAGNTNDVVDSTAAVAGVLAHYQSVLAVAFPSSSGLVVSDVEFWDSAVGLWAHECKALDQGDRLQRIVLAVTDLDAATTSLAVVKRPPNDDVPTVGIVTPAPFGSSGGGGSPVSGSFAANPCLTGCSTPTTTTTTTPTPTTTTTTP